MTVAVALLWPWVDPSARRGLLLAALVAYPVQVCAFALLVRWRDRMNRFLAAWVGGTLVRMGLILAVALVLLRVPDTEPLATLLSLAGFLFGLLLLEPFFFRGSMAEAG